MWLDPNIYQWNRDLQKVLKPFEGEMEIYPVTKDVNKVGNNSSSFLIPLTSSENKSNIANFFAKSPTKGKPSKLAPTECEETQESDKVNDTESVVPVKEEESGIEDQKSMLGNNTTHDATDATSNKNFPEAIKRKIEDVEGEAESPSKKVVKNSPAPEVEKKYSSPSKSTKPMRSATKNNSSRSARSQQKPSGNQSITNFLTQK